MLVDIKVPVLAESIDEATLLNWQKRVGDQVKSGENLIDIETDKVTLEVAVLNDGVITEIIKNDGETVKSGELIARIETDARASTAKPATPEQQSLLSMETGAEEPEEADLPKLSPAVRNLMKEHQLNTADIFTTSDRISKEDVLLHIENKAVNDNSDSKESIPEPIPESAFEPASEPAPEPASEPVPESAPEPVSESASEPAPKPAVVNEAPAPESAKPIASPAPEPTLTSRPDDRQEEKVPMTRLRKRVAERLLAAQHENAILTTFNEINMQPVMDIRNRYKEEFAKTHGTKLGFMSFFTRATTETLKKFPIINASADDNNIIYHGYFDIGIAVSSPRGLVVPVIRNTDLLSLAEIEKQIRNYGEKARDGKLSIEELTGGTFTITNGGVFGSLLSTPIINPPQSAILGMHAINQRPVAENGEVVVRPMMYLALSYDHRIIDGSEAVQFLVSIKQQLEDPARLLLQL